MSEPLPVLVIPSMSETITQNDQASLTKHTGMHFDAYESGEDRSGSQHRNKLQT